MATRVDDSMFEVPGLRAQPRVGDSLAERYRLEKAAGHNEAGLVFDAVDRRTNRRVAIEVATSLREHDAWDKWQKDAMVAQQLEGEHVLRVFDVGVLHNGVPYLVRERVLSSLSMELQVREHLPLQQAVAWTLEIAEAVAEAHANGAAHGDLRADNVFVARGGNGVVIKVGWATAAKAEGAAKEDASRDIAALGAILRQLATGRPSEADGAPTLPSDLAHVVARALSPDPATAFGNVSELAQAIAPFAPPGHPSARTIAFLLSRAGILQPLKSVPMKSEKTSIPPTSLRDAWFTKGARESAAPLAADLAPPKRSSHGVAFAAVSVTLIAAVLGGSWLLFSSNKLPRWTGAAPPEEQTDTTEITSAPVEPATTATAEPAAVADAGLVPIDLSSASKPAPAKPKASPAEVAAPAPAPAGPTAPATRTELAPVPVSSLPDAPATTPPATTTPAVAAPPATTSTTPTPNDLPKSNDLAPAPRSPDVPETFGTPD